MGSRRALHSTRDLPKFGSVMRTRDYSLPWRVAGLPVAQDAVAIDDFLITLAANDCSSQTLRSYAFDLLRWWRFLAVAGNRWDTARREDVRDLVLWMRQPQTPNGRQATLATTTKLPSVRTPTRLTTRTVTLTGKGSRVGKSATS